MSDDRKAHPQEAELLRMRDEIANLKDLLRRVLDHPISGDGTGLLAEARKALR